MYNRLNDEANGAFSRKTRSIDDDENDNFITDTETEIIEQSDIITTFLNKSEFSAICVTYKQGFFD